MRILASVLCLLSFVLPVAAAPTNLSPKTDEANPVQLLTNFQRTYLYENDYAARAKIMKAGTMDGTSISEKTFSGGSPVKLSWKGTTGTCTVSVRKIAGEDGSVAETATVREGTVVWTGTTSGSSVEVVNLEIGAGYTWTVTDSSKASASATFWTSPEPPRLIKTGSMKVMRDMGGWTGTLGGRQYKVRQNQLFRGGPATGVDEDAKDFFYTVVGVKTELDLRGSSSDKFDTSGTKLKYVGLSRDASYKVSKEDMDKQGSSFWPNLIKTFESIFDAAQRPAYFHCSIGRDRTGVTAELTLALLGVSLEDIWRDYETSAYKQTSDIVEKGTYFAGYVRDMAAYKKGYSTFNEQVEAYFIEDLGFTKEQIETFRTDMLINYGEPPEPPKPTYHVEEPVYVTATRITFAAGQSTGTQYTGFLTKQGREYAWGKDGEALTDWVRGDGTPCDLKKPSDDCELMVK